jgi:hypothetical protein
MAVQRLERANAASAPGTDGRGLFSGDQAVMTKIMLSRLVLVGMAVLAVQRAHAASAVAMDIQHGHIITSRGQLTKEIAIQHALTTARERYGANVELIAASDVDGLLRHRCRVEAEGSRHTGWHFTRQALPGRSR